MGQLHFRLLNIRIDLMMIRFVIAIIMMPRTEMKRAHPAHFES